MHEREILNRIIELRNAKKWTNYKLAKESGIPYSTLNTMFNKTNLPTIPTLAKICRGLGVSLVQFFTTEETAPVYLTEDQGEILSMYNSLTVHEKHLMQAYMKGFSHQDPAQEYAYNENV